MAVLAIGPAHQSTDSLRLALNQLGYATAASRPDVTASLLARKLACRLPGQLYAPQLPGSPEELRGMFEPVLHRASAFLGQEAAVFGPELVRAYPEAKVILNRQKTGSDWDIGGNVERAKRWGPWAWELLNCRSFWRGQVARMLYLAHFYGDNEGNRARWHDQHFRHVEVALRGIRYLEWDETDGWSVSALPGPSDPNAQRLTLSFQGAALRIPWAPGSRQAFPCGQRSHCGRGKGVVLPEVGAIREEDDEHVGYLGGYLCGGNMRRRQVRHRLISGRWRLAWKTGLVWEGTTAKYLITGLNRYLSTRAMY